MNGLIITLALLGLVASSVILGIFVGEDSLVGVLCCSLLDMIFVGLLVFNINFEEPNPYTPATVIAHNDSTTIFQEVDSDKVHIIDRYYEDDNQYLLDIVDDEIVVVWRVDEGSLG